MHRARQVDVAVWPVLLSLLGGWVASRSGPSTSAGGLRAQPQGPVHIAPHRPTRGAAHCGATWQDGEGPPVAPAGQDADDHPGGHAGAGDPHHVPHAHQPVVRDRRQQRDGRGVRLGADVDRGCAFGFLLGLHLLPDDWRLARRHVRVESRARCGKGLVAVREKPVSFGSPHVRSMGVRRTCGEPDELKTLAHARCSFHRSFAGTAGSRSSSRACCWPRSSLASRPSSPGSASRG